MHESAFRGWFVPGDWGYVFTIRNGPKEPDYRVGFPDSPEIITSEDTMAGAFANTCEALNLYLETPQKLGQPFPKSYHRLVVQTS